MTGKPQPPVETAVNERCSTAIKAAAPAGNPAACSPIGDQGGYC